MEVTRPLAALVAVGIVLWTIGAVYTLLRWLVGGPIRAALPALAIVAGAVVVTILVGRRSARWTENPEQYW